ncbi:high-potential iron-sulfur protein [Rhodovibrio salinarum]|uniref:High potential iron-sulfur proteins family profile domain-containing protein n=1 Tax=Rhodovibrio salinarum TaxID=1087 RepID=A0A934QJS8_9PROT|nr:high-potential iron-sulfur protein [Rhodovibrio salinarum]MBK1698181.1 hypothetical protein [Rhodovibrio salinarum]
MKKEIPTSRRKFLSTAGTALAALGGAVVLARSKPARAQKAPKQSVQYQEEPKQNSKCANCNFFIQPESGEEMGSCQIVAGKISPNGWCNLWSAAS